VWKRAARSPWLWGSLGVAAVGVALAIRLDLAGFLASGGRAAQVWAWIERASWLAGIAGLVFAAVGARAAGRARPSTVDRALRALPLVRDVTARQALGIHPAIPLEADAGGGLSAELPLYVPRDADAQVRAALSRMAPSGGFLLLVGPPAAGKTRSAAEAMQHVLGDWRLCLWPAGFAPAAYLDGGVSLRRTVVWLDDVHELLAAGAEGKAGGGERRLTAELIRRLLLPQTGPVILIGTTWPDQRERFSRAPGTGEADLFADARKVLGMAYQIDVPPGFSDGEWGRAVSLSGRDPRLGEAVRLGQDRSLPATLASARELVRRWRHGGDAYGRAVISAAVDARRCGHPEPVPTALLEALAAQRLTGPQRAAADARTWFAEALSWACRPVRGDIAALTPSGSAVGVVDGYRISDILLDRARSDPDLDRVTDEVRRLVVERADPGVCWILLASAHQEGKVDIAEAAGRRGAVAGDVYSLYNLAVLRRERGDDAEAERLYRRAVAAGHVDSMYNLAVLLDERGETAEAELLLRRAEEAGDADAMGMLGDIHLDRGETKQAERHYRRAVDAGLVAARATLAVLLVERGETAEAELLYRRAVEAGDLDALNSLAELLRERGETDEAELLYRRAIDAGQVAAVNNLAILLTARGDTDEAERLFRRAVAAGQAPALYNLAILLDHRGEAAEAAQLRERFRRAQEPPGGQDGLVKPRK
jgi:hypothetical protein